MNIKELPSELISKIQGYAHDYPIAQFVNKSFFESTKKYPLKYESLSDYTLNYKFNETIGHLMFNMNRMAIKGHFDIIPLMIEVSPRDLPFFYDTGSITLGREGIAKAILASYALLIFNLFGKFEQGRDIYDIYYQDILYMIGLNNIQKYTKPMLTDQIYYVLRKYKEYTYDSEMWVQYAVGYIDINKEVAKNNKFMIDYKVPRNGHLTYPYYMIKKVRAILEAKLYKDEIRYLVDFIRAVSEEPVLTLDLMVVAAKAIQSLQNYSVIHAAQNSSINPLFIHILRNKYNVIYIPENELYLHSKIIQEVYNSVTAKRFPRI